MDTPMRPRQMPRTRRKRSVLASCDEVIRESSRWCSFMFVQLLFLSFSRFVSCGSAIRSCLLVLAFTLVDFSLYSIVFMALVGISFPLSLSTLGIRPWGPGNHGYDYDSLRFNDFDEDIPLSLLVIPFSLFGC